MPRPLLTALPLSLVHRSRSAHRIVPWPSISPAALRSPSYSTARRLYRAESFLADSVMSEDHRLATHRKALSEASRTNLGQWQAVASRRCGAPPRARSSAPWRAIAQPPRLSGRRALHPTPPPTGSIRLVEAPPSRRRRHRRYVPRPSNLPALSSPSSTVAVGITTRAIARHLTALPLSLIHLAIGKA